MTVEQVLEQAQRVFPNISRGTVYRNLNLMADTGEIRRLHIADQPIRFDINTLPHQHVVCVNCGSIVDIADIERDKIQSLTDPCAEIVECALIIYVVCEMCTAKEKNKYCAQPAAAFTTL